MQCVGPGLVLRMALVLHLVPGVRALYAHGVREIVSYNLTEILCNLHGMGVGSCSCCC